MKHNAADFFLGHSEYSVAASGLFFFMRICIREEFTPFQQRLVLVSGKYVWQMTDIRKRMLYSKVLFVELLRLTSGLVLSYFLRFFY